MKFSLYQNTVDKETKNKNKRNGKREVVAWPNHPVSKFLLELWGIGWTGCWNFHRSGWEHGDCWPPVREVLLGHHPVSSWNRLLLDCKLLSYGHCKSCKTKRSFSLFCLLENLKPNSGPFYNIFLLNLILLPIFMPLYFLLINSFFKCLCVFT